MSRLRSLAFSLAAVVLLGGAVVLAVLQVQWVSAWSRDEEGHLRATLALGLGRVRRDAEDELRALAVVLRLGAADMAARDWSSLTSAVELWEGTTRYPGLLKELYLIPQPGSPVGLVYDRGAAVFRETSLPADLTLAASGPGSSGGDPGVEGADATVFLPVAGSREQASAATVGVVALRLDPRVLYTVVLPSLVERHLAGFPYRIVSGTPPTVLYQGGDVPAGQRPEARLALSALVQGGTRWTPGALDPGPEGSGVGGVWRSDPDLRSWLLRLREERSTQASVDDAPPDGVLLDVFYPGGSIAGVVRFRRAVNLSVGGGILAVMVLGALALYRLYRRSARLRSSEQEFVATVSHELRTPIAVIQATSENLRRGIVDERDRVTRYGGVINEQARRLSAMVESILYYSGLESSRVRASSPAPIELAGLLERTLAPLAALASERGKSLRLEPAGAAGAAVRADATAVRLVVENLVMNAIVHASGGEIRVRVEPGEPVGLRIVVEDDGPGIPAREQRRIFEPFVRGEKSSRDQHPGSGLGLHLVRRVVRMEGGEAALESPYVSPRGARCTGCRFTVTLP